MPPKKEKDNGKPTPNDSAADPVAQADRLEAGSDSPADDYAQGRLSKSPVADKETGELEITRPLPPEQLGDMRYYEVSEQWDYGVVKRVFRFGVWANPRSMVEELALDDYLNQMIERQHEQWALHRLPILRRHGQPIEGEPRRK